METIFWLTMGPILVITIIWLIVRYGGVETPKEVKARKQREIEGFESMTLKQQNLHIHVKNKVVEFNLSIVFFLIACIISGAVIYYVNRIR